MYTPKAFNPQILLPFSLAKVRITVIQFLICSLCFMIFGLSGMGILLKFEFFEENKAIDLLQTIPGFNINCRDLLLGALIIQIIMGLSGLLVHFMGYLPKILSLFRPIMMTSFGLIILASVEIGAIGLRNTENGLRKIQLSEEFYYKHRESLFGLSNDNLLFSKFQKDFQCCGTDGPRDWLFSGCNCIPKSCCITEEMDECSKIIFDSKNETKYKELGFSLKVLEKNGKSMLWKNSCQKIVMTILSDMIERWNYYCAIYITIHLILCIWMTHIIQLMFHLFDSREGYAQLRIFKGKVPSKSIKIRETFKSFTRANDSLSSGLSSEDEAIFNKMEEDIIMEAEETEDESEDLEENSKYSDQPNNSNDPTSVSFITEKDSQSMVSIFLNPDNLMPIKNTKNNGSIFD